MEIKCGTDIIEIERIKQNIENEKTGEAFVKRVFTEKEIQYCESKKGQKYQHYAGRFAAKEAVFKAISDFLDNKYQIEWKDIEILSNNQGKPILNLEKIDKIDKSKIESADISISHCKEYAIASVVIIFNKF